MDKCACCCHREATASSRARRPATSGTGTTPGQPINLTVGCGDRVCVSSCMQVSFDAPACTNSPNIRVIGRVESGTNLVTQITYQLNGGLPQQLCANCSTNPSFDFPVSLAGGACADNTLTVTATSAGCAESYVTKIIRYDTRPPEIRCPPDIITPCVNTNQLPVTFDVTATNHCSGGVTTVCTPASGSMFPAGTTLVTCSAEDACGNRSTCSFNVTVQSQIPTIERAVIVRWGCGILQGADNILGPWTDIPGASNSYCVPANQARKFYQTRVP